MSAPSTLVGTIAAALAAWLLADAGLRAIALTRQPDEAARHDRSPALGPPAGRPARRRPRPRLGLRRAASPLVVASWLDAVAASVRAGRSLRGAVVDQRLDDPVADEQLHRLRTALDRGDQLATAVARWNDELDADSHLAVAAMALTTAAEVGGAVTQPLERSAAILRQTAAADDERRSWASQARLSAVVMTALPPAVLGLLLVSGSTAVDALRTPLGAALVGLGIALDIAGFWWMRTIVRRAAP